MQSIGFSTRRSCAVAAFIGTSLIASAAVAQVYSVHEISRISDSVSSEANHIDERSWIVGRYDMNDGSKWAYRYNWVRGSRLLFPLDGDTDSVANASGYVGTTCGESDGTPVKWFNEGPAEVIDPDGLVYSAVGANFIGSITGSREHRPGITHAYLWNRLLGEFQDLGVLPGGTQAEGQDINMDGTVCGWSYTTSGGEIRAFLWDFRRGMINLGILDEYPNSFSYGVAINDNDQVLCQNLDVFGPGDRAFIWDNGTKTDLGLLFGTEATVPTDLNNRGQAVGYAVDGLTTRALVWYDDKLFDLNRLIDPNSDWELLQATGINDRGHICGIGLRDGVKRGFLLRPRYVNGAILINNVNEKRAYVFSPENGHYVATFSTSYAENGVEIIDEALFSQTMLMSDSTTGVVHLLNEIGGRINDFNKTDLPGVRGIAQSINGFIVGTSPAGFAAWDEDGNQQSTDVPGDFKDIIMIELPNQRYYVMTENDQDNIEGYKLNLMYVGQSRRNGIPNPQQLTEAFNKKFYLVAGHDTGRVYAIKVANGKPAGSFPVNGSPIGVAQLDSGEILVTTTTGVHVYTNTSQFRRTVLNKSGFQYIGRSKNFKPY